MRVTNTDISLVEVIHFCYEASKGNHKFLEALWSDSILKCTSEGNGLSLSEKLSYLND